jgi:Rod binding domain-containing protein
MPGQQNIKMYDQKLSKLLIKEQESCGVAKKNFKNMTYGRHHTRNKQNILPFYHSRHQYIILSER